MVSNNSAEALNAYLRRYALHSFVQAVVGRQPHRPDLMKPHPSLVAAALELLDLSPHQCVFIGDALIDVLVSHATSMPIIGYVKHPRRYAELLDAGADAVIANMNTLASALPSIERAPPTK